MYFDYLFEKIRSYADSSDDFEHLERACRLVRKLAAAELDMADATQLCNMTVIDQEAVSEEPEASSEDVADAIIDEDGEPAAESDFSGDGLFDLEDEGDEGDEPSEGDSEPDAGLEFGEGLDPLSPDSPVDNSDTVPEVVIRPSAEFDVFDDAEGLPEDDLDDADGVS